MPGIRIAIGMFLVALVFATAPPAAAELPSAGELLADIGFTPAQIAQVEAGEFVNGEIEPSSEREIVAAFAFLVKQPPDELVREFRKGIVDATDPNTIAFAMIPGAPTLETFAKLSLQPNAQARAQAYARARPGSDLNLSSEEIATFAALGAGASIASVEQAVRAALLARLTAYQAKGLAGIAPYAGAGGKQRSPADELRSATHAAKRLQSLVPDAYALLLDYPADKPAGTEEAYRWSHYEAHGTPTIALTHSLYVPEGDAWVLTHRQFYVSTGYNSEQAVGALLPMKSGTLVIYSNRTSTDQVSGFGGGAKRSIGSKLLASQLQALYETIRAKRTAPGS